MHDLEEKLSLIFFKFFVLHFMIETASTDHGGKGGGTGCCSDGSSPRNQHKDKNSDLNTLLL